MAKTADDTRARSPSAQELGQRVRELRRRQGLSRSDVARSSGLTRKELSAYERGAAEMPETDLFCIAGSCGVDVAELLPERTPVVVSTDLSSVAIGDSVRRLRGQRDRDDVLGQYRSLIEELRRLPPGAPIPAPRSIDLVVLADALGDTPEAIEQRLMELASMDSNDAARVRGLLVGTEDSATSAAPGIEPMSGSGLESPDPVGTEPDDRARDPYLALAEPDTDDALDDFFATPRAADPFAPPPPLEIEELVTLPAPAFPLENGASPENGGQAPDPGNGDASWLDPFGFATVSPAVSAWEPDPAWAPPEWHDPPADPLAPATASDPARPELEWSPEPDEAQSLPPIHWVAPDPDAVDAANGHGDHPGRGQRWVALPPLRPVSVRR